MSLDGFIAKADNTIGHLFDWFDNGDVELRTINPEITFHLNQESFDYWQAWMSSIRALVCGRTQRLELGLLDEVAVDLVPVVLGGGRPFFGDLVPGDIPLGDPTTCVRSDGVIHLVYPVRRA